MNDASVVSSGSIGARLDRLPLTPWHRRILILIGTGMFLDAFDINLGAGVLGALVRDGWSTLSLNAAFVSVTFIGMTLGAAGAGLIGDRYGRRLSYQINLAIFGGASLLAAFAPNMTCLIVLRFFMGIGLGAEIVVGYATLTEFVPAGRRGYWICMLAVITNASLFVASALSLWLIPHFGWRPMFLIVGVAAIVVWNARKAMPESPRWLEAKGRHREAELVVAQAEASVPPGTILPPPVPEPPGTAPDSWRVLLTRPVVGRLLIGMLLNVTVGFSLYGFINWLPTFMLHEGQSLVSSLFLTMIVSAGAPLGPFIGMFLADRLGRKPSIVLSSLAAAALGCGFAFTKDPTAFAAFGFLLVTALYVMGLGFTVYTPELFATPYRMRASAICGATGRLATACVQYVVVTAFVAGGVPAVVGMLICLLVAQAIVVGVFGVETKGRSLEAIAAGTSG
jgi:putative MFS transporter